MVGILPLCAGGQEISSMILAAPVNVTNDPARDIVPAWSADGKRLVFASDRSGDWEIFAMEADGTNPLNLSNSPSFDYGPMWSPDGRHIAFTSDRDGDYEVYVMDVAGGDLVNLTDHPAADGGGLVNGLLTDANISWSPDGQKIAFATDRDGNLEIYVLSTAATAVEEYGENLPLIFLLGQNFPNPFNNSTTIFYTVRRRAEVELAVYNLAGQKVANLVRETRDAGEYSLRWNGLDARLRELASGIYFYRLRAEHRVESRKLLLLR